MQFDIVRGKISKPEQCRQLISVIRQYMKDNDETGTLYLGYPLTANADEAIMVEALWVTKNKGMVAFIFGDSQDSVLLLKEQQDSLYYNIDFYLKKYSSLRKGRNLAFAPLVITVVPNEVRCSDENNEYIFCKNEEIASYIEGFDGFDKTVYKRLCEVLQKVSEIKPRKKRINVKKPDSYGAIIKKIEKEIANLDQWQKKAAFEMPDGPQRIKGLAGSGKTTVAMHRISFILYTYAERFRPDDFYIVGSNRILLDYITGVLPDLDVHGVRQMTMEQLFVRLLYEDWDERKYRVKDTAESAKGSSFSGAKGKSQWFRDLEA